MSLQVLTRIGAKRTIIVSNFEVDYPHLHITKHHQSDDPSPLRGMGFVRV